MIAHEIGDAGLKYLKSILKIGDHLANALLQEPLSDGSCYVYLPDSVDPRKLSLEHGGLSQFEFEENLGTPVRLLISEYLFQPKSIFVMELQSVDRAIARTLYADNSFRTFTFGPSNHKLRDLEGNELHDIVGAYGYIRHGDESVTRIRELLADRRPFWAVGALTTIDLDSLPANRQECDSKLFIDLARNTQYIVGSAYDDEGVDSLVASTTRAAKVIAQLGLLQRQTHTCSGTDIEFRHRIPSRLFDYPSPHGANKR